MRLSVDKLATASLRCTRSHSGTRQSLSSWSAAPLHRPSKDRVRGFGKEACFFLGARR